MPFILIIFILVVSILTASSLAIPIKTLETKKKKKSLL